MNCSACNLGVPYPHATIAELVDGLTPKEPAMLKKPVVKRKPQLTKAQIQLAYNAVGFWSSDYNDAPHEDIKKLRATLVKMGAKP